MFKIKFNSIRFKVSLFYTLILGVILVVYTGILYFGQRYSLYRNLDNELVIKAQEVANAINSFLPVLENDQRAFRFSADLVIRQEGVYPDDKKTREAKERWLEMREKLDIRHDYIIFIGAEGEVIANSANLKTEFIPYFLKDIAVSMQKTVAYKDLRINGYRLRTVTMPYYYKNKRMYLIRIGSSLAPIVKILYGRMFFALFTIPLILLLTSFLGGVIAQRILRPVMQVTNIAKNITYKDLNARVKVEHIDDELRYLVDAFNEMIFRLDNSFRYIDEFSSNVAHELKTPLTIISGESELALMQKRDIQEYSRVIKVNFREAGHMLKIVDDLLLLSRLEYRPEGFKFEQVDFIVFINEIFEQAKKLASSKNIDVVLDLPDTPIIILADWLHLRRLFINLLNNAVKFTPTNGKITIVVKHEAEKIKVSVSDTGIGIAVANIGKIFDRFFRIDHNTGSTNEGNSGLGLSIAQSIAKIHHGNIYVESRPQKGSTFTVSLPII